MLEIPDGAAHDAAGRGPVTVPELEVEAANGIQGGQGVLTDQGAFERIDQRRLGFGQGIQLPPEWAARQARPLHAALSALSEDR